MANNSLIIGGSSGIGAALVTSLVEHGQSVTHLSRAPEKGPYVAMARGVRWDALSEPFPSDCLPERLDGLVYCPGSIRLKPFGRLREQELRDDLELNLMGAVRALQGAYESLKRSDVASVVFSVLWLSAPACPFMHRSRPQRGRLKG